MGQQTNTLIFFLVFSLNVISQTTGLIIREKYVVYKLDTFNRKNEHNLLTGKGLAFYVDTVKIMRKTVTTTDQTDNIIKTDSVMEFKVDTHVVGKGNYKDNRRIGVWFYSSKDNIDETDAKVTYEDGKITEIICYSNSTKHKVVFKTKNDRGRLKLFWLNPKSKKFEEQNSLNIIIEIYHLN